MRYIGFFLVFLILAFPYSGFSLEIVADGREDISGKPFTTVRAAAISKSLQESVEIAAKKILPDLPPSIIQELRTNASIYVKSYRVISEFLDGGVYRVTVKSDIDSRGIKDRLESLYYTQTRPLEKPTITIELFRLAKSGPLVERLPILEIRNEILGVFLRSGYKAVESGGQIRLETVFNLKTESLKDGRYSAFAGVTIRAKDRAKGELLAQIYSNSSSSGLDVAALSLKALGQAGVDAAYKIKAKIDETLKADEDQAIEIYFYGVKDYAQYKELDKTLEEVVFWVERVKKRTFRGTVASFEVLSKIPSKGLAGTLAKVNFPGFSLNLERISEGRVEFSLVNNLQ